MSSSFFASAVAAVSRAVAPTLLAAATFCGAMGVSSVAAADEQPAAAAQAPAPTLRVEGPRFVMGPAGLQLLGPRVAVVTPPAPPPPPPPPPAPKVILRVPGFVLVAPAEPAPHG